MFGPEFESLQGQEVLSASKPLGSGAHPPSYSMDTGVFSRGQKRPGREVDRSLASNVQVKNEWSNIAAPPVCLHEVDKKNCILM